MRAVNLIPGDQRSGAPVGAGRSDGVAYAVLAMLVAVAVLAVLYGKASRDVSSQESQVATLTAQAQRAQAQASALAPYTSFVALREQRAQAVATLVDSRFDWAHAFHEFGRVLTGQTSITSLDGEIAGTTPSSSSSSSSQAATVASATPPGSVPLFTLTGCATSQDVVAQMLQRLRLIDGVSEVTLQSSTKSGSAGSSTGSVGGCTADATIFSVQVTFDPLPAAATAAAATQPGARTVSSESSGAATSASDTTSSSPNSGGKVG
ncbi:MAG: hypothetical protein ACLQBB_13775 [Solirubrobacteraceae bacterium]